MTTTTFEEASSGKFARERFSSRIVFCTERKHAYSYTTFFHRGKLVATVEVLLLAHEDKSLPYFRGNKRASCTWRSTASAVKRERKKEREKDDEDVSRASFWIFIAPNLFNSTFFSLFFRFSITYTSSVISGKGGETISSWKHRARFMRTFYLFSWRVFSRSMSKSYTIFWKVWRFEILRSVWIMFSFG